MIFVSTSCVYIYVYFALYSFSYLIDVCQKAMIVEGKSDRNFVNIERKKKSIKLFDNSIAASKSA